jgi:hypothetical protein
VFSSCPEGCTPSDGGQEKTLGDGVDRQKARHQNQATLYFQVGSGWFKSGQLGTRRRGGIEGVALVGTKLYHEDPNCFLSTIQLGLSCFRSTIPVGTNLYQTGSTPNEKLVYMYTIHPIKAF